MTLLASIGDRSTRNDRQVPRTDHVSIRSISSCPNRCAARWIERRAARASVVRRLGGCLPGQGRLCRCLVQACHAIARTEWLIAWAMARTLAGSSPSLIVRYPAAAIALGRRVLVSRTAVVTASATAAQVSKRLTAAGSYGSMFTRTARDQDFSAARANRSHHDARRVVTGLRGEELWARRPPRPLRTP